MKTSSAKAKGRRHQQWFRDLLIEHFGFDERDCESTGMGQGGADIKLSKFAFEKFPYEIECKAHERLNIWAAYKQAQSHGQGEPLLVITRNRAPKLVVIDAEFFVKLHRGS